MIQIYLLVFLNILDAILTTIGMNRLGLEAEGNPLLYHLMTRIGVIPALVLVKGFVIFLLATATKDLVLMKKSRGMAIFTHSLLGITNLWYIFIVSLWIYVLLTR